MEGVTMGKDHENLMQLYEKQPVVRGLVALACSWMPVAGTALDVAIINRWHKLQRDKLKGFFDELGTGAVALAPELLESQDFLHCYFATVRAVLRTRRREKIRLFARMLKTSASDKAYADVFEYEELLSVLDELSVREMRILAGFEALLREHAAFGPKTGEVSASAILNTVQLSGKVGMKKEELTSSLMRLARTGCVEPHVSSGALFGGGLTAIDKWSLTPIFYELKQLIGADYAEQLSDAQ